MKHKTKFAIAALSAVLTIGILAATIGKPPYCKMQHHRQCQTETTENQTR